MVLILLPPSESKAEGTSRRRLDVAALVHPELGERRERVLDALGRLAQGPGARARTTLGLSPGMDAELARDTRLRTAPTGLAREVYTGVLYDAIGFPSLSQRALRRLDTTVLVTSALFGLVGLADRIPAYRLSAGTVLPHVGNVNAVWAPAVTPILAGHTGLIVDLRSTAYMSLGPLPRGCEAVVLRVLQRVPTGPPKVVTHSNKATKGRIVRAMATAPRLVQSVDQLAELVAGMAVDVVVRSGKAAAVLEVVVEAP